MKKFTIAILLSGLLTNTAFAAATNNFGFNYSFDEVFGTQFEFDISKAANNRPVSVQLFWKSYSQRLSNTATWKTIGVGAVGIYDLTSLSKFDKKIHPYVGLGMMTVSYSWAGSGNVQNYNGVDGGLYVTGGMRYFLGPEIDADVNFNTFGGLTAGVNFKY